MKVTAVLTRATDPTEQSEWVAHCEEIDLAGEGATPEEAVRSLREALREYFGQADAVAPPPETTADPIEITVIGAPAGVQA